MKYKPLILSFIFSMSLAVSANAKTPSLESHEPQGPQVLIADTGFRPSTNGFQFENYGSNVPGLVNLTTNEMRRMFGDRVCASMANGICTLTPPAQKWMESQNRSMNGGHCEGMAVLASLIYSDTLNASSFGAATTPELTLPNNSTLQKEIAYWFSTQATRVDDQTPNEDMTMTPAQVVQKLQTEFGKPAGQRDWFVLGLYKPQYTGGHAVTPYAIDDTGNGVLRIMVYDNNFPNQERFVVVNTTANTWSYTTATNPSEPQSEYTGDASTKTLTLAPLSLRLRTPICPFCDQSPATDMKTQRINNGNIIYSGATAIGTQRDGQYDSVAGQSQVFQSAESFNPGLGRSEDIGKFPDDFRLLTGTGVIFTNTIPGASAVFQKTGSNSIGDDLYYLPADRPYTSTVYNLEVTRTYTTSMWFEGPGFYVEASDIVLAPRTSDKMVVKFDDANQVYTTTYITEYEETPLLAAGLEAPGADYNIELLVHGEGAGKNATLIFNNQTGKAAIYTQRPSGADNYDINLTIIDDFGEHFFQKANVTLDANSTHYLNYQEWVMGQPLKLEIDRGRDGTIDQTVYLQNEYSVKVFMPFMSK